MPSFPTKGPDGGARTTGDGPEGAFDGALPPLGPLGALGGEPRVGEGGGPFPMKGAGRDADSSDGEG